MIQKIIKTVDGKEIIIVSSFFDFMKIRFKSVIMVILWCVLVPLYLSHIYLSYPEITLTTWLFLVSGLALILACFIESSQKSNTRIRYKDYFSRKGNKRTYDNLSDAEKDKFRMYMDTRASSDIILSIIMIFSAIWTVPGLILVYSDIKTPSPIGLLFLVTGAIFLLMTGIKRIQDDKYFKLIFGMDNYKRDLFNISKSDIDEFIIEKNKNEQ